MTVRSLLGALLSALPALTLADGSGPTVPDTPAGHALSSWLNALNSGERDKLDQYRKSYDPATNVDFMLNLARQRGGFDLESIRLSEPTHLEYILSGRASHNRSVGELDVTDTDPPRVIRQLGTALPAGATFLGYRIDAETRKTVINVAAAKLNEHYVFSEVGKAMALHLSARAKRGEYNSTTDGESLAELLTAALRGISHDKHLVVTFSPIRLPGVSADGTSRPIQAGPQNCAFDKAERLPNNIGYIKFDAFVASDACADVRSAAMAFLAGVDALIFDLRDNHGGANPDKGPDLLSYLFDRPVHLSDIYDRTTGRTTEYWIQPIGPEKQLGTIPVYVLTSPGTFSAAEYFTYNLQALKRATIVGEVTGGGSHLVSTERIDDRFGIRVPYARPINPITKTDWEGVGVIPDVKVSTSVALATAEELASAQIQKRSPRR